MNEVKAQGKKTVPFGPEDKRWIDTLPKAALHEGNPIVSGPVQRPSHVYPEVAGIDPNLFEIPASGLTPEQHTEALRQAKHYRDEQKGRFLGFQANQSFRHLAGLEDFLQCQLNNLGDPFKSGNFTLNSKWLERAVLDHYASLWKARWPHDSKDPESYWGYVLSMGSTEGNLYGLWNAREYLSGQALMADPHAEEEKARRDSMDGVPRKAQQRLVLGRAEKPRDNPNMYTPVIFFSEATHYSIHKAVRALRIQTFSEIGNSHPDYRGKNPLEPGSPWPAEVPTKEGGGGPGSIDIDKLVKLVEFFAARGYPILVFFNYGTTFKGAYDDVGEASDRLKPIFEKYGLINLQVEVSEPGGDRRIESRDGVWFHVDGALGAAYMPFLEMAYNAEPKRIEHCGPRFDFGVELVKSIVMSGHKWIGAPWPCGIYMTRTKLQMKPPEDPEYVGSPDTTFAGSRNGFSALLLWNYAATHSYETQIERALGTERMAVYAFDRLHDLEVRLGDDLWVERTFPCALTIRFREASPRICHKYSLSGETLFVDGVKRKYSHIFIMPHTTETLIDDLVADLVGEIPEQPDALTPVFSSLAALPGSLLQWLSERLREILGEEVVIDGCASSISFRAPRSEIMAQYRLEPETYFVRGRERPFARLDKVDSLPVKVLEALIRDLSQPGAFDEQEGAELELAEIAVEVQQRSYFFVAHRGRGFK